jgi:nicotinamidase-related amidase
MKMNFLKKIIMLAPIVASSSLLASAQDNSKKALLVIDVQENLLLPASKMHMDTAAMPGFIENLNNTIDYCTAKGLPALYTINEWTNPLLNAVTGNVCKKGSKGTGIDTRLHLTGDLVYRKSKKSALSCSQLLSYLKQHGISELYITGLFAEYCVKATARDAVKQGFKVWVVKDAVGSKNSTKLSRSMKSCESGGAAVIGSGQLADHM